MSSNHATIYPSRYLPIEHYSIQIRDGYCAREWLGYGYVGVVECDDPVDPDIWLPIRNTNSRRVVWRTDKMYMSITAKAEAIREAQEWIGSHTA